MTNRKEEMTYSDIRLGELKFVDASTNKELDKNLSDEEFDKVMNTLSQKEFIAYVEKMISLGDINREGDHYDTGLLDVTLYTDGYVDLDFKPDPPFDRIRRITGYLVGTLDRFNDAKRHEVQDRVKHNVNFDR